VENDYSEDPMDGDDHSSSSRKVILPKAKTFVEEDLPKVKAIKSEDILIGADIIVIPLGLWKWWCSKLSYADCNEARQSLQWFKGWSRWQKV